MIPTIIILSLLLFISVIANAVQKSKLKKYKSAEKDEFNSPLAKLGILQEKWDRLQSGKTLATCDVIIQVKAIQYSNGLSKIKILNLTGAYDDWQADEIKKRTPEFIKTDKITFVEPEEMEIKNEPFGIKS